MSGMPLPPSPPPTPSRNRTFSYDRPGNDEHRDFNADESIARAVRQSRPTHAATSQPSPSVGITRSTAVRYTRGTRPTSLGVTDGTTGFSTINGDDGRLVDNDLVPLQPGLAPIFQISDQARTRNRAVMARENAQMMRWRRNHEPARWGHPFGRMGNFVLDDDDELDDDDNDDNYDNYNGNGGTAEDCLSTASTAVESWVSAMVPSSSGSQSQSRSESEDGMHAHTHRQVMPWLNALNPHTSSRSRASGVYQGHQGYRGSRRDRVDPSHSHSYDADISSLSVLSSSSSSSSPSPSPSGSTF
ncbi:hypothetical protein RBB50_009464 [Rhinocladiella similis]